MLSPGANVRDVDSENDFDWPPRRRAERGNVLRPGGGFALAKEAFGSRVERRVCSVYDADPSDLGTFDLVVCGMVLIHLRDQLLALERIARLCAGTFITVEEFDPLTGLIPFPAARYRAAIGVLSRLLVLSIVLKAAVDVRARLGATAAWLPEIVQSRFPFTSYFRVLSGPAR